MMNDNKNYHEVTEYLEANFEEVEGCRFYRELFPNCETTGELNTDYSKPNAIYLYTDEKDKDSKRQMRRRIMLTDTWEEDYMNFVERNEKTLCGGLTYRGRSNKLINAQQCNALVIDLDGVGDHEIRTLFLRFGKPAEDIRTLPMPTYLVASGSGLHIYYVLDEPIDLFPNIKLQLKNLKYDLTFRMWDYKSTSQEKNIQYQSINQGFRMVGSMNTKHNTVVKAYRVGDKVSLEYLNQYVKSKVDITQRFRPTKMTKAEALLKYPEWAKKFFDENGEQKKNVKKDKWDIAGKVHGDDPYALYHWWLRKVGEAKGGHRYFYLMGLAIYACKVEVPRRKLKADMMQVFEKLKEVEHTNPLSQADIDSALEAYSKEYHCFKRDDISKLTDIPIPPNKRNWRKRAIHIKYMNNQKMFKVEMGECTKGGRPKGSSDAKQKVQNWRNAHPSGRKIDCQRETGLSRPTVLKWWDYKENENG